MGIPNTERKNFTAVKVNPYEIAKADDIDYGFKSFLSNLSILTDWFFGTHTPDITEKQTMGCFLAGKVSAVIGSGSKALTADSRILAGTTAYITDAGRTGSLDSVGGYEPYKKIREYQSCLCQYAPDAWKQLCLQAIIIDIEDSGKASAIKPVWLVL